MISRDWTTDPKSIKLAAAYNHAWQRYAADPFNQSKIDNLYRALHKEADHVSLFTARGFGYQGSDPEAADQYVRQLHAI